ncbi:phosphoribosyltransferase [Jeotgalibaca sp. A122]|uniref:phosphoribosyltransferase n=1 Tax=Jeotgalibaca sp. A122 TaxID=3457322 RepID=UPI003FD3E389
MFKNREDAGMQLAEMLLDYQDQEVVVFTLPRGGVPLGVAVAKRLNAPLDLIITRKIGHPFNPEYAIGAISENGKAFYNQLEIAKVDDTWLENEEARLRNEIKRRRHKYGAKEVSVSSKTAIIVDDGIATGFTMLAAIDDVKKDNPNRIIVAIPVVPERMAEQLEKEVDEVVAIERTRAYLGSVGAYYKEFGQITDEEILEQLDFK